MTTGALRELAQTRPIAIHHPQFVITGATRSKRDALTIRRPARPRMSKIVRREIPLLRTVGAHNENMSLLAHRIRRQPLAIGRNIRKPQLHRTLSNRHLLASSSLRWI